MITQNFASPGNTDVGNNSKTHLSKSSQKNIDDSGYLRRSSEPYEVKSYQDFRRSNTINVPDPLKYK